MNIPSLSLPDSSGEALERVWSQVNKIIQHQETVSTEPFLAIYYIFSLCLNSYLIKMYDGAPQLSKEADLHTYFLKNNYAPFDEMSLGGGGGCGSILPEEIIFSLLIIF